MKTKNLALIVIAALVLILGGCGCGGYNNMIKLDESVKSQWGKVQSEYQRRADLIPNLVSTVKGEANFEQTTLQNVIAARASATQVKIDPTNLTPEKIQEFQQAQGQLSQALGRLLMVTENYPTLRANDAFRGLQTQLEGTENRIKVARNDFNTSVQEYNSVIRRFPNTLFAGAFGFKPKGYFQAEAGSEKAPEVKF
ncbi:MAG: LemA family protein [Filimonas sp.]|nr:LemA family protein [Filimonas sp.]